MPAVDVHQHLWPEALIRTLERRSATPRIRGRSLELAGEPGGDVDYAAHELEARLALLDRHELDAAVISLAPTMETDPHHDLRDAYHEGIAELVAASGGRLVALAANECREGFAGACVSAGALAAGADSLLADVEATRGLLFVHPGPPAALPAGSPPWWPAVADYTAQMQAAYLAWLHRDAHRFPELRIVFAILAGGAPIQVERLASRGVAESTVARAAAVFDTASYGPRALALCLDAFGPASLAFGSDAPVIDPGPSLAAVRGLDPESRRTVLEENTARLLGANG